MVAKKVIKAMKNVGWYEVRVDGSHHQFAHKDFPYVVTVPVHSGKDLSLVVLKNIEKGTGLSLRR